MSEEMEAIEKKNKMSKLKRELEDSFSWEEADKRFENSRWEVDITDINNGTIGVDIIRDLTCSDYDAIYVGEPNWLERVFKITFKTKMKKAIRKQQERCNQLNMGIVLGQKQKLEADGILSELLE